MNASGRRVLVVGANRPAALEAVRQCVARGDRVIATAERPTRVPALTDLAVDVPALTVLPLDPTDPPTVRSVVASAADRFGALDLVIYGGIDAQPLAAHGEPPRDARLDTLQPGGLAEAFLHQAALPLVVLRALVSLLAQGEAPRVLVLSSWLGSIGGKTQGGDYALCASLAGLHMLLRAFAHDVRERGIVVTVGNPGPLKTEIEGPAFKVPVERAVAGMLAACEETTEEESGRFVDWTGAGRGW
ncbi:MAG: SDR family NAD(P)-dependent oxidoreductase [Gemmatimonadaceae bacterium]|jgi:NAD(P)-dependent dehydrogenase (short-subunit alcohol dehydrogenase family)|nr:SDR family NAD(P)-dependent oxidoreductase [Gemmatimonadaceae bacterium]